MATPKAGGEGSAQDNRRAVFVGNLDFGIEENALREHFAECGEIVSVRLIRDGRSGMGKGFGYVNFESEDAVELAMGKNGSQLKGRAVRTQR